MFRKVRRFCRGFKPIYTCRIIPVQAGIQNVEFRKLFPNRFPCRQAWIPACAGMTDWGDLRKWKRQGRLKRSGLASLKLCFQTALKRGKPPIGNLRHIAMFDRIEMQIIEMAGKIGLIADFIVLCSEWFCRSDFRIRRFGALRQWIAIAGMLEVLSDTIIRPTVTEIFCILRGENIDLCFQY